MTKLIARFALVAMLTGAFALPAFAQSTRWKVDSEHSDARFGLDARINESKQTVTMGAAKVSGTLRINASDPTQSTFEFSIYPAGAGAVAADPNGDTSKEDEVNYTLVNFRSVAAALTGDGRLKVTGALTVIRVEREAELNGNEGYAGPEYTSHEVSETTHVESFLLALPSSDSKDARGGASAETSAFANINGEDFPELVNAVLSTQWPAVAQDKSCEQPATNGEDYSGYLCTGSSVAVPSDTRTASSFGEDYPGGDAKSAEVGNNATIALHLRLTQEGAQLSAKTGQ